MKTLRTILFIFLSLITGFANASDVFFEVSAWVKKDDKTLRRATVSLYEGEHLISEKVTNPWGNFTLYLQPDKEYTLIIGANDCVDKVIYLNTTINGNLDPAKDYAFGFIVDMYSSSGSSVSSHLRHVVVYDKETENFVYYKPIVTEHLDIDDDDDSIDKVVNCPDSANKIS